jgi:hypothetical protein
MSETMAGMFRCEVCGRRHRWTREAAGSTFECGCGEPVTMPVAEPLPDDDLYGLAEDSQPRTPELPQPAALPQAQAEPVLTYQRKVVSDPKRDFSEEHLINHRAPVILVLVGMTVEFGAAALGSRGNLSAGFAQVAIEMLLGTGLMFAVMFYASWARGFKMGSPGSALLKLLAISVAPSAAMRVLGLFLGFIPLGFVANWGLGFCFYFALLGVFFELDQDDTWYCVVAIFLTKVGLALALFWWVR